MAADSRELVLLRGWAKTGVGAVSAQRVVTQGFGAAAMASGGLVATATNSVGDGVSRTAMSDGATRTGGKD